LTIHLAEEKERVQEGGIPAPHGECWKRKLEKIR